MREIDRIDDQLQRAFEGDAWHGAPVEALLAGVTAEQAAARPIPAAHSIWELVLHMTVWLEVIRRRLEEGVPIELTPAEDWPAIPETTGEAWRATLERHRQAYRDLRGLLARLGDERLAQGVAGKDHDAYVMLHGIIQHELYHAGQIALLKKALG
jgi:uncharacterized damage-inducible protein DinB